MTNVLIVGAGSIGNHLAQAVRRMDWKVTVCDRDKSALMRMHNDIYPMRYGAWDPEILLMQTDGELPQGDFDIIMIGTPPDSHMTLALKALKRRPKLVHIEKPLLTPKDDINAFEQSCLDVFDTTMVTVGYDHAVAPSVTESLKLVRNGMLGKLGAVYARTLEHWEGIFKAHPWLEGPHDSYLGYWERGGGALCEHSHALHLGITFADAAGVEHLMLENHTRSMVRGEQGERYDQLCTLVAIGNTDFALTVTQDVITKPTEKAVRVVGDKGVLDIALSGDCDTVILHKDGEESVVKQFPKSRPDDFYALMKHYDALLSGEIRYQESPIHVDGGIVVMHIIQETFLSEM